ncbi:MAG: homoserine O-acetyltransferase MetX [Campylobacterota bacterium]
MKIATKIEKFTNPLYLESGRILEPYQIIYETYGTLNEARDNVIVVCHALSGNHHAAGYYKGERKPGWWDKLIGEGKPIDTDRYYVVCTNTIGSCFGSTGPTSKMYPSDEEYRLKFPVVTIKDMVRAQHILFNRLGIYEVKAVIGGSMGGMQALQFGVDYPNFAKNIIALAATHATRPWVIAFNKVASEAIIKDGAFKNGEYDREEIFKEGFSGLSIGRMAGHISYLSPHSMDSKFGRDYVETDGLYDLFGRYEVDRYLDYNAANFSKFFDPISYLYIIKAINIFDLSHGYESLEHALNEFKSNLTLISFASDMMFMPQEMQEIEKAMHKLNKKCEYHEIESNYGHDAFLVEVEKFEKIIQGVLK